MPQQPFDPRARVSDVVAAYRLLLGRDPDPSGLAYYESQVRNGISLGDLAECFLASDEHRAHRAGGLVDVDCGGYIVCVDTNEHDFGAKIARHKGWEPHVVAALRSVLRAGDTFVDIGANVGVMAFAGAAAVGPGGSVVAVEPNHRNLQRLYAGIVRNGFAHVRVVPFAAGAARAIVSIEGGSSNSFVTSASPRKELVQTAPLDEVLGILPALHAVKIDIEGFEPDAIAGFRRNLARHRPAMLLEYNPRCLRDHAGLDPRAVIEDTYALLDDVRIVEHSGAHTPVDSPARLWQEWEARDREATASGLLPAGMLHFDLLGRVRA